MDTDTTDTSSGVNDTLNGETKPDPAKLAQTAIIKQDVMLSGTSTQSPVSSILTMPTVSMSAGSMATMGATSLMSDSIFLSSVPSMNSDGTADSKHDVSGARKVAVATQETSPVGPIFVVTGAVSQSASAVSSPAPALLGQPQVAAPQYIVTAGGVGQSGTVNLQQLLIPVSTANMPVLPPSGNGTQQLLSIPVSLAAGAGNQIQLLTTANGQLIATNLSNLSSLSGLSNLGAPLIQSVNQGGAASNTTTTQSNNSLTAHLPHQSVSAVAAQNQAAAAATQALPQLITNAQGQIVAFGAPQMLTQTVTMAPTATTNSFNHVTLPQTHANTATSSSLATAHQLANQMVTVAHTAAPVATHSTHSTQAAQSLNLATSQIGAVHPQVLTVGQSTVSSMSTTTPNINQLLPKTLVATGGLTAVTMAQPLDSPININTTLTPNINQLLPSGVTTLPPNINQLLPNTVSNSSETTTVDGINLDEIKEFAKQFKIRRLSLGLTQTQVGQALSATEGPSYSQSAICRFEKLDITPKSAQKIKPVLERWMAEAEERYKNGVQNLTDFIGSEPSKKRKRRTSFTPQALEVLNEHFERNTHPSGAELTDIAGQLNRDRARAYGAEMTELSDKLNYDREVIRVWFCNKRQALKNTIKKLKSSGETFS